MSSPIAAAPLAAHWLTPRRPDGPNVALLHGFTQNARCWGTFASHLGETHGVVGLDLPGHGDSGHDSATVTEAGRLATTALAAGEDGAEPTHWVGYSMGGRIALSAAVNGSHMRSLTLIGASAGLADATERAQRIDADHARAARLRTVGLDAFLADWLSLPLFAALDAESAHLAARARNRVEGLATSLEHAGTGSQEPLWDALEQIAVPVLVLAGETDAKFIRLGEELSHRIGTNARFQTVPNAGHACHLEQPSACAQMISDHLKASA